MTNGEIARAALEHLEYGTDDESLQAYFGKFVIYINSAVELIARDLRMTKTETVTPTDGAFNVSSLAETCEKVVSVTCGGKQLTFTSGDNFGDIYVGTDDDVQVKYRFIPAYSGKMDETPQIPEQFHRILYLYVVHMHYNTGAGSSDLDRTKWLQMFMDAKSRLLKRGYGAHDKYEFTNMPWDVGL